MNMLHLKFFFIILKKYDGYPSRAETHSHNDSVIIFPCYTPQKTSCNNNNNNNVRKEYKTHALRKLILFRKKQQ